MAFNYSTIGLIVSPLILNHNFELEGVTLTSVGLSITRQTYGYPCVSFVLGLTPPGDENIQVYESLVSGILSPSDGLTWVGSIRVRDLNYLVLNYATTRACIAILTWTTTS
jgi:hypothetical protein